MTKVLIVEDEEALVTILKYNLEKSGFQTYAVTDGKKHWKPCAVKRRI